MLDRRTLPRMTVILIAVATVGPTLAELLDSRVVEPIALFLVPSP